MPHEFLKLSLSDLDFNLTVAIAGIESESKAARK
jgi:hypothetical protein